jgi:hypothetical protein
MAHVETMKNVSNEEAERLKPIYEQEGATVIVVDQGGGLSTIIAIFPDEPTSATAKAALAQGTEKG